METVAFKRFKMEVHGKLVDEITSLLHRSYKPLADKGMRFLASHQNSRMTIQRLTRGESYLAFDSVGKVVGTITLIPTQSDSRCQWYNTPGVFLFGQFAVDPNLQGLGIGIRMMDLVEARAKELGAKELALDTSEHAGHLIQKYTNRGYRFVQQHTWDEVNYRSVVMSKSL